MFTNFTNLYQLSKTLRFELIPQGKTLEMIQKKGLLQQDLHKNTAYKMVKIILDEYHKNFMSDALSSLNLKYLEDFAKYYNLPKRDENQNKEFKEIQQKIRKEISNKFSTHVHFPKLFSAELFKIPKDSSEFNGILLKWIFNNEETADRIVEKLKIENKEQIINILKEFNSFATYFSGFHKNRENMYSSEEKSTSISFRLTHQNLPKFIDNIKTFNKIKSTEIVSNFTTILSQFKEKYDLTNIDLLFELDYFNKTLTQEGIDKYNNFISGYIKSDGISKVKGINEYINLYNQSLEKNENKIAKLKPLFKQILFDRNTISFLPEQFQNDQELLNSIESFFQEINSLVLQTNENVDISIPELFHNLDQFDSDKILIANDTTLAFLSNTIYKNWDYILQSLRLRYDNEYKGKNKFGTDKYENERDKELKSVSNYSIQYLDESIRQRDPNVPLIKEYYKSLGSFNNDSENHPNLFDQVLINYKSIEDIIKSYPENKNLINDDSSITKIKLFLDSIKTIQQFVKPFLCKGEDGVKDEIFYAELERNLLILDQIIPIYNKVRNYLTKKSYSTEKYKLNFESGTLLNGWSQTYETKSGLLFENEGNYYLGLNNKKLSTDELKELINTDSNSKVRRIIVDFQKPDNKNIPRLFIRSKGNKYSPAINKYQLPINDVIDIYDKGTFKTEYRKKNKEVFMHSLHKIINYFKLGFSKHDSYKHYNFMWRDTNEYNDIAEFYTDVETSCYQIKYEYINWNTIEKFIEEGKIYLFQIYNKDFSSYSKGTPNLHTLYWKMLFDKENLENVVYKLNGQAEIFYRKKSIKPEDIYAHKENEPISNKNHNNKHKTSIFPYKIIKNKRFTEDKFHFHVPITLNFKAQARDSINDLTNQAIKQGKISHVIGIDRGERHLLYLCLIDLKGNILKQFSLNEIVNEYKSNTYITDYHSLLTIKEENRDDARMNWKTIESIKELKEGYLSQVIHILTEMIVEYNAILVLEDLNYGFKQGRQKIEKSVYQKFEKMLIDKLNYYVVKNVKVKELRGLLNALQLTNQFESFKKLGKQSGFIFYIPAWNTSKMDPLTGFVNLFDCRYDNIEKSRMFFSKFESIQYNKLKHYFEFEVKNYSLFNSKAYETRQDWIVCTYGERIVNFRNGEKNNNWDSKIVILTDELIKLLLTYKIKYELGDLKEMIINQTNKSFFKELMTLFSLTLQMRNSTNGSKEDYIISPIADQNGVFFDSRLVNISLPLNADANGAYNIARKGLWAIEKIQQTEDLKKVNLSISNKEWLQYAQNFYQKS